MSQWLTREDTAQLRPIARRYAMTWRQTVQRAIMDGVPVLLEVTWSERSRRRSEMEVTHSIIVGKPFAEDVKAYIEGGDGTIATRSGCAAITVPRAKVRCSIRDSPCAVKAFVHLYPTGSNPNIFDIEDKALWTCCVEFLIHRFGIRRNCYAEGALFWLYCNNGGSTTPEYIDYVLRSKGRLDSGRCDCVERCEQQYNWVDRSFGTDLRTRLARYPDVAWPNYRVDRTLLFLDKLVGSGKKRGKLPFEGQEAANATAMRNCRSFAERSEAKAPEDPRRALGPPDALALRRYVQPNEVHEPGNIC